jgi:hypothetical protein
MILLRNQAVTFVVLLGYIGLSLFYFKDKLNGLLDYMAFNLPMVYSDIIHFADFDTILIQRLAYFLMGVGFIFATIRFLGRLPQTGKWNSINLIGFVVFVIAGLFAGFKYYSDFSLQESRREKYISLNTEYADMPVVDVISNDLIVVQHGRRLNFTSHINIQNQNMQALDTLIFSLNPGLKIDSIVSRGKGVKYEREAQLIKLIPENSIPSGRRLNFTFYYRGIPDESIAYLDIDDEKLASLKRIQVATLDKKAGIFKEEYILLTSEILWYPVAGVGFNKNTFRTRELDFSRFTLAVTTKEGLTAVVPGRKEEKEGTQSFFPETDLNSLPLVIGRFENRTITVGKVEYNIYLKPGHDFYSEFFPTISDTLNSLIQEAKDNYEYDEVDLFLEFQRINLVEVPIQFHPYERPFTQAVDYIQPEIIFIPEKGAGLYTLDFKRLKSAEIRRNKERNNTKTDEEIEVDLFKNFMQNTFLRNEISIRGGFGGFGGVGGEGIKLIEFQGEDIYTRNPFTAFPLYFNLITGISSNEYPAFNSMIETYLKEGFEVSPRQGFAGGISDNERANLALKENSLTEIFATKNPTLVSSTIYQAGSFIITALKNRVGLQEFDNFLYYYLEDRAFTEISFRQFADDFNYNFNVEIEPYLEFIKSGSQMPEFLVSSPELYQTRDDYGDVFIIKLKISNIGGSAGLVDMSFRMPGSGGFGGGGMTTEQRLYEIESGLTKDIQLMFYDQPRMLTINTLVSGNIPSSFSVFLRSATPKNFTKLEEYERNSGTPVSINNPEEIVVDNEDPGFSYVSVSNESKIKKYIDSRKVNDDQIDYQTMNQYWTPANWTTVAHSSMYGETIRSAMVARSGDGSTKAKWTSLIPNPGFYDLYVYIPVSAMYKGPSGRRRGGEPGGNMEGGGEGRRFGPEFADKGAKYLYLVSSNEGDEEVVLSLDMPEDGWNRLGTFHFPADSASITLSNDTNGTRIIADAVKWVPKD